MLACSPMFHCARFGIMLKLRDFFRSLVVLYEYDILFFLFMLLPLWSLSV